MSHKPMKLLEFLKVLGLEVLFPLDLSCYQWRVGTNSLKYGGKKKVLVELENKFEHNVVTIPLHNTSFHYLPYFIAFIYANPRFWVPYQAIRRSSPKIKLCLSGVVICVIFVASLAMRVCV